MDKRSSDFEMVAGMRIVLAHQSVGEDVLEGVKRLVADSDTHLPINHSSAVAEAGLGITHFLVGANGDPERKLNEFSARLSDADNVDVALLKFCYVDFAPDTDGHALASRYIQTLDTLQKNNVRSTFAAITAPLTTVQTGPKAWVKRMLGRSPYGCLENRRREEFNADLRLHFPAHRLFDLAAIEADPETHGLAEERDPGVIRALDPRLSSDGGHLNAEGRVLVASAFVTFLAKIGRTRSESARMPTGAEAAS